MIVVVGQDRFGLVAEVHEELKVPGRAQHGAGVKLVSIGCRSLDFANEGFSCSLPLVCGTHGEQPDHADAGHRPETHGADDPSFRFRDENMFLPRILFEAFEGFSGPSADLVEAGILAECGLLHQEERRKIYLGRWSNMNHRRSPGRGNNVDCHSGIRNDSQGRVLPR